MACSLAVNGKVVSGASGCRPRRGYICLESEGSECHFRNIRIREWPSTSPAADEVASLEVGFKSLYPGLDVAGWQADPSHLEGWRPRDWILECGAQGPDSLATAAAWGDAEFIVDWRIEGGGSASLLPRGSRSHEIRLESTSNRWTRTHLELRGESLRVTHGAEGPVSRALRGIPVSGLLGLRHHDRPVQFANLYARSVA